MIYSIFLFFFTLPKPRTSLSHSEMKLRFHILGSKTGTCILLLALPLCTGPIEITMTPAVNSPIRPWGDPFGLFFCCIFFLYYSISPFSGYFSVSLAVEHNCPSCSRCHVQNVRYAKFFGSWSRSTLSLDWSQK